MLNLAVVALSTAGAATLGASAAQATGSYGPDYGPDTCLQGYVWREAVPSDHVCVLPATRDQVRYDNSQAPSRWVIGAYGPHTCIFGYVWREAVPGDDVCVTGSTRSQAAADNAQAAARRNSLRLWHTTYTVPPRCNPDGTCTITSTDNIRRYRLVGDHINVGPALVELRRLNGSLRSSWTTYASAQANAPGGRFTLDTGYFVCNGPRDSYFRVRDSISTRWSEPYYVSTVCFVL